MFVWCQGVPAVVGDTEYCTDCKKFFTDFKEMLTDKTQQVSYLCLFRQLCAVFQNDLATVALKRI